ncbi:MAG: hypothetical protein WCF33_16935 [Pseudonocardiaceae bacterium]
MIEISDFSETSHSHREPGQIQLQSTDNSDHTSLIFTHEADGSWTIHGLGVLGLTLTADKMIALAESILGRAR